MTRYNRKDCYNDGDAKQKGKAIAMYAAIFFTLFGGSNLYNAYLEAQPEDRSIHKLGHEVKELKQESKQHSMTISELERRQQRNTKDLSDVRAEVSIIKYFLHLFSSDDW